MSDAKEKIYVGSGRVVGKFNQLKLSLNTKKLNEHANEKGYVSILVQERKTADEYGNTHSVIINDWAPPPKTDQLPF